MHTKAFVRGWVRGMERVGLYLTEALLGELLLLKLEHEGVELLLEPLVGVVDQELLEGVGAEGLETEDVEQADEPTQDAMSFGERPREETVERAERERERNSHTIGQGVQ